MNYCAPIGLRHSEFLSWDRDDRDAAIVWALRRSQSCPGCGVHPDEWDPAEGGHRAAFVAEVVACPGCAAVETRQNRMGRDRDKGRLLPGSSVVLRRRIERTAVCGEDSGAGVGA